MMTREYLENERFESDAVIGVDKGIENAFRTIPGSRNSDRN